MTIVFSPVSTGGTGYSMNSQGCILFTVAPLWSLIKVSLHLHLLTGGHFSATQAGGASVRAPKKFYKNESKSNHFLHPIFFANIDRHK